MLNITENINQLTIPSTTYLESHFQGTDSKNTEKFMKIFEEYASTLSGSERETILKNQIDNIEKSILKNDTSQLRPTLFSAIIEKSPEFAIKYMSILRSSINLTSEGRLPLIQACQSQHVDLVKELIKNGANPDLTDSFGRLALGECIKSVDRFPSKKAEEIFDALLGAQCDVNLPVDMVESSPLILCLTKRIDQWAQKLLPLSDIHYKNSLGLIALHQAVRYSSKDMISALINKGSDVNALAREGIVATRRVTPCHIAVAGSDFEALQLLLDAGADPHLRATNAFFHQGADDKEPYSAYLMAVDYNKTKCIQAILKKCPPKSEQNDLGFERTLTSTSLGKKRTLKHIAEAEALKSQSNRVTFDGVSFSVEASGEENLKQMVEHFFTKSNKDGSHLYLPIWDAICKYAESNEDFVVIFSPEVKGSLCGKYNPETHNEIFIYHKTLEYTKVGEAMVHEMAHKCADMIYKSYLCAPCDSKHPLYEAIKTDLANLSNVSNEHAKFITNRFTLAHSYSELQRPQECIARIPQVIFALIHKFGLSSISTQNVMQECLPNLYEFYIKEFLPECKKLLQQ